MTYTGSLGRNGREKRNTVPRTPTKSYQCSVVSETVSISLRRRQSLGGNGNIKIAQEILGHSHLNTTADLYLRVDQHAMVTALAAEMTLVPLILS